MKIRDVITEGGWANPATQNTHITPALVEQVVKVLHHFVAGLNQHLAAKNMPPVELGNPCGSTTYYKRDLVQNPEREYGDIDVNFLIPRIEGTTNNANADIIKKEIAEYCETTPNAQTANGTNVILQIGNDYVQVDLVMSYSHNKAWTTALAPEYNVKGVLCNSVYSSLGEALGLSIGSGHGVQVKTQDGKIVPFRTVKGVELKTITTDPKSWAMDIAKYFGCKKVSPRLKAYPGMIGEIRVADMINSARGIAETLEMNGKLPEQYNSADELLEHVKAIYLDKINKVVTSSKFDKAATPAAIQKAEQTKELLSSKSQQFASLFTTSSNLDEANEFPQFGHPKKVGTRKVKKPTRTVTDFTKQFIQDHGTNVNELMHGLCEEYADAFVDEFGGSIWVTLEHEEPWGNFITTS